MEPIPENLERLRWLLEMRDRRQNQHPETVHHTSIELPLNNLQQTELEVTAALLGVELTVLIQRYLAMGLKADLDALQATHGPSIGHTLRKRC